MSPNDQPTGQAVRPVAYPATEGQQSHRWGGRFVDLIVMVVVVAAAAVTAAVVFGSGERARTAPPRDPGVGGGLFPPKVSPGPGRSVGFRQAPADTAEALDVGGLPLMLAPGWKVAEQGRNVAIVRDKKDRVLLMVVSTPADEQDDDVRDASVQALLAGFARNMTKSMEDVEYFPIDPMEIEADRFQEGQFTDYTGLLQTQDGTSGLVGTIGVLRNTSTGDVAGVHYFSGDLDEYVKNLDDFKDMLGSLVFS